MRLSALNERNVGMKSLLVGKAKVAKKPAQRAGHRSKLKFRNSSNLQRVADCCLSSAKTGNGIVYNIKAILRLLSYNFAP